MKTVQRPSLLPKDSAEFRGWYDTLPQTQPQDLAEFRGWQKALPQMQPKKSEAFREWLQATRENASQRSVDLHQKFKSKPPTADTDVAVRRLWYNQKPVIRTSRTGSDAKNQPSRAYGARVGAGIGKIVDAFSTPFSRARMSATNSQTYNCRQCGKGYRMGNLKRDKVPHLSRPANKKCFDLFSESSDKREM